MLITFYPHSCVLQDLWTGIVTRIGKAKLGPHYTISHIVGVYPLIFHMYLFFKKSMSICTDILTSNKGLNASFDDSFHLRHQRLGHVSSSRTKLIPHFQSESTDGYNVHCPVCPLAKQSRLAFPVKLTILKCLNWFVWTYGNLFNPQWI